VHASLLNASSPVLTCCRVAAGRKKGRNAEALALKAAWGDTGLFKEVSGWPNIGASFHHRQDDGAPP
jgi:hypothetical protein